MNYCVHCRRGGFTQKEIWEIAGDPHGFQTWWKLCKRRGSPLKKATEEDIKDYFHYVQEGLGFCG